MNYIYDKVEEEPVGAPNEWPGAQILDNDNKPTGNYVMGTCVINPNPTGTSCP
jgi:hypothetical protein